MYTVIKTTIESPTTGSLQYVAMFKKECQATAYLNLANSTNKDPLINYRILEL